MAVDQLDAENFRLRERRRDMDLEVWSCPRFILSFIIKVLDLFDLSGDTFRRWIKYTMELVGRRKKVPQLQRRFVEPAKLAKPKSRT